MRWAASGAADLELQVAREIRVDEESGASKGVTRFVRSE